MNRRTVVLACLAGILAGLIAPLTACDRPEPGPDAVPASGWHVVANRTTMAVYRVDDRERGATCYVFSGPDRGGIDCDYAPMPAPPPEVSP